MKSLESLGHGQPTANPPTPLGVTGVCPPLSTFSWIPKLNVSLLCLEALQTPEGGGGRGGGRAKPAFSLPYFKRGSPRYAGFWVVGLGPQVGVTNRPLSPELARD